MKPKDLLRRSPPDPGKHHCLKITLLLLSGLWLSGCGGYPRYLSFPYDRAGRGLNSASEDLTPHLSPPYLVLSSDRNGSQGIYLFNIQSRQLQNLPGLNSLDQIASQPAISEDGRYVVFAASRQGTSDIYLYDRETQQKRNITASLDAETRNPTISANGDRLAFEVAKQGQWDIMVTDRQGNRLEGP